MDEIDVVGDLINKDGIVTGFVLNEDGIAGGVNMITRTRATGAWTQSTRTRSSRARM